MSSRLSLSPRDRRTLLRGVVVIATIVSLGRGVPAWRDWDARMRFRAATAAHEAAVAASAVRQLGAVRDSVTARTSRLAELSSQLFESKTSDEATAALAMVVAEYSEESGVKVNFTQLRPTSGFSPNGFARVGVRMNATSDVDGLVSLLSSLEGAVKLIAIRDLTVTQPEPAAPESRPEALRFEIVVEALARRADQDGQ